MSFCNLRSAMFRIRAATPESPILVLRSKSPGVVEVYFASTVWAHNRIRRGGPDVVGVFDNTMNDGSVEYAIYDALFAEPEAA
jgi:hypothetical protein